VNKIKYLAVAVALVASLAGCKLGEETNVTCEVVARDTTSLTTQCKDNHGKFAPGGGKKDIPSDLYPKCQVGTFYPVCKEK
jgi:hypothetical protein